jgi:hypothetical protein
MGNNDLTNNENILVKVDHNNLIYIDPNSVVKEGEIEPRGVKQENLMMYVNLEADLVPRSVLVTDNNKSTLVSVAKGTLNFLQNKNGDAYDTSWTNAYNGTDIPSLFFTKPNGGLLTVPTSNDNSGQSFGIDGIEITTKGFNAIPQVTINFIDVRGKTLFESPQESPYKAFFHLPWPIFYLTVKGYYGKAIRYRLHLVKFNTKFNESNGNFEITTNFVGSTYAYLNDIPINGILNSPYMYKVENSSKKPTFNTQTGNYDQIISKSSRGYQLLESVFKEYRQKGLVDKNFPTKTLREVIVVAESLDKILEREIFDQVVNADVFAGVKEYEKKLQDFENQILAWGKVNLSNESFPGSTTPIYYFLSGNRTNDEKVVGDTKSNSLERIIKANMDSLDSTQGFANNINRQKDKSVIKNTTKSNFATIRSTNYVSRDINKYYKRGDGQAVGVAFDALVNDIRKIEIDFIKQRDVLEREVEKKMNEFVKDPKKGIGFDPTIRNIFAVLLANAEVYIRLLKDVHNKAFESGSARKDILVGLSDETPSVGAIYPWPEVKKNTGGGSKHKVISYPGDPELAEKLQTSNYKLWPEVEFVENYQAVATKKDDTLADKEGGVGNINYIFESNIDESKIRKISTGDFLISGIPYVDKSLSSLLYEIYERGFYTTLLDSYDKTTVQELVDIEFNNISESIKEDFDIVDILKGQVTSKEQLINLMKSSSPFERYPYFQDQLPTTEYLKDIFDEPFVFEQYYADNTNETVNGKPHQINHDDEYPVLNQNLKDYFGDEYRKNIYPFSSKLYLDYINEKTFSNDEFKFAGALKVDTVNGFITSTADSKSWVKDKYETNLFSNKFVYGYTYAVNNFMAFSLPSSVSMLNTPYFHRQIYNDFFKTSRYGKYAGSAYLLLNSLPFRDLEDRIKFGLKPEGVRVSSLFREVGATHFIPYHLLLKWGSLYHRYKKYILEGSDILNGFLTVDNLTRKFDGAEFFDNNANTAFTVSGETLNHSNQVDIGIHPYYDAIFHQVINGYDHYDVFSGNTSFSTNVDAGGIRARSRSTITGLKFWTTFVDNQKYDHTVSGYTLLPCDGNIPVTGMTTGVTNEFIKREQRTKKIIWDNEVILEDFDNKKFPSHSQYNRNYVSGVTTDNVYGMGSDYRKIMDLIGTFSPKILDDLEDMFLSFSTEVLDEEMPYQRFPNVKYYHFQDILKSISTVKKYPSDSTNTEELINQLKTRQQENLIDITNNILSADNLIKFTISNPKEIDPHLFYGFVDVNNLGTFKYGNFNTTQVTVDNLKYIDLYIGEDTENKYLQFFATNDVELKEYNIKLFRPLIQIFAGYLKTNPTAKKSDFQRYISSEVLGVDSQTKLTPRQSLFLDLLTSKFNKLEADKNTKKINAFSGYNDGTLKLELYNYFKSFNDKWVGGNSLGQKLLFEEFLFLDKANKDIGSDAYFNIQRLIPLADTKNQKISLYGAISILIQGTGFDMRALPAYVNFYGANHSNKTKSMPSKTVANNLFGTFLEVDYQESSPKVIIQYTGPTSKHLELSNFSKEYRFADDSFDIQNVNKNPLIITAPEVFNNGDLYKSNRVVAFEVSFGDQNQSIFKGVSLDQASIKNTTESFIAQENLARSESGANSYQVDIGLFDIYRQASYTCKVSCMGNVMIQPTMYFYVKNIPMFKGTYWIMDVSHSIKNNTISTNFTGVRIPSSSLPNPKDSLMSSYKALFDSITNKAVVKVNQANNKPVTQESVQLKNGNSVEIDRGSGTTINGEVVVKESGVSEFGVPYNGYGNPSEKYIQLVEYNNSQWFRACVVKMSSVGSGNKYEIPDGRDMSIIGKLKNVTVNPKSLKWEEIKDLKYEVYSTRFQCPNVATPEKIIQGTTIFFNPQLPNSKEYILKHEYKLDVSVKSPRFVKGPVNIGPDPSVGSYGIAMSDELMAKLKIAKEGDVVYFKIIDSEPLPTPTPTPTPTPNPTGSTPTPTPSGMEEPYNIVTVFAGTYDQATSFILKDQFVGSWKFTDAAYRVISSPCNSTDVIPLSNSWVKPEKVNLNLSKAVDDTCPSNNNGGTYSFEYKITLQPILPDGSRDTNRGNKNLTYVTSVSVAQTQSSATINYLGEYNTIQGNDSSYYNIEQNNGKFKVMRIVDTNFNWNNVGFTQFKDPSGAIVPNSCSAGSGSYTCTVNSKVSGTYTMNAQYYPNGPLNSSPINLVSQSFTQ